MPAVAALSGGGDYDVQQLFDEPVAVHKDLETLLRRLREPTMELALLDLTGSALNACSVVETASRVADRVPVVVLWSDGGPPPAALIAAGAAWVAMADDPIDLTRAALARIRERWAADRTTSRSAAHLASHAMAREHWGQHVRRWADELLHEVRTPVAIVQGFCSNLMDGLHGELTTEQHQAASRIRAAADHMGTLLLNAGEDQPRMPNSTEVVKDPRAERRTRLSLGELCYEVVAMFEPRAEAQGVWLVPRIEDCPQVWRERTRLVQLLVNLVSNALRFTPKGGVIEVALAPAAGARGCRLSVADTGPGMTDEVRERIFEAGFTTSAGIDGHAGMGLTICADVAREHGGWIRAAESKTGARFVTEVPIDPRTRRARVHIDVLDHPGAAGRLLAELAANSVPVDAHAVADIDTFASELAERGGRIALMGPLPSHWRELCPEF